MTDEAAQSVSVLDVAGEIGFEEVGYPGLLRSMGRRPAETIAIRSGDTAITYGELLTRVAGGATHLRASGVEPGDHVAFMVDGGIDGLAVIYAIQLAGAVAVPVYANLLGDTLRYVLDHSDAVAMAVSPPYVERVDEIRGGVPGLRGVFDIGEAGDLGRALRDGADPAPLLDETRPSPLDPAFVMYTSGTTGSPKGVVVPQLFALSGLVLSRRLGMRDPETFYIATPYSHGIANSVTAQALWDGGTVVIAPKFSASRFWEQAGAVDATVTFHAGTMARMLMNQPHRATDRAHSLRTVIGAAMPAEIWPAFEQRFGVHVVEVYSSIDGGGATFMNFGQAPPGSIGRPSPETEARIVDDGGQDVLDDAVGELLVRPTLSLGGPLVAYYRDEAASEEKTRDGWVWTGDLVRRDADGWYWFVDRKKDVIRRRGVNIAPAEIERLLLEHPGIAECSAFAVPSDLGEDEVKVVVVPGDPALVPMTVAEHAAAVLPAHMAPRYIELRAADAVPKTEATTRVQRFVLREGWRTPDTWDVATGSFLGEEPRSGEPA